MATRCKNKAPYSLTLFNIFSYIAFLRQSSCRIIYGATFSLIKFRTPTVLDRQVTHLGSILSLSWIHTEYDLFTFRQVPPVIFTTDILCWRAEIQGLTGCLLRLETCGCVINHMNSGIITISRGSLFLGVIGELDICYYTDHSPAQQLWPVAMTWLRVGHITASESTYKLSADSI